MHRPRLSPGGASFAGLLLLAATILGPQLALVAVWAQISLVQLGRTCASLLAALGITLTGPAGGAVLLVGLAVLAAARELGRVRASRQRLQGNRAYPGCLEVQAIAQALGLQGRVELVRDARPLAYTRGLLRCRVVLSTGLVGLLDREELLAVVAHERCHLERREPLRQLLSRLAEAALFFLPAARELARRYRYHRELEADAEAARVAGPEAVDEAFLKIVTLPFSGEGQPAVPAAACGFGLEDPDVLGRKGMGRRGWIVSAIVALVLVLQAGLGLARAEQGALRLAQCTVPPPEIRT